MHAEIVEAFDVFRDLISGEFDCEPQDGGHFYIAHKPGVMPKLEKESKLLNDVFGYDSRIMGRDELHKKFPNAKIVTAKNAGHWVHAEAPDFFYDTVISFLQG